MNIWQRMRQEFFRIFIADRRRGIFIIGASLAYLILFSLLYANHVINRVPLLICDEDQSALSHKLVQAFYDSEKFQIRQWDASSEDMETALREREVYAALYIPQGFSREVKTGRSGSAALLTDGANILVANTVTTAAQEIVGGFSLQSAAAGAQARLGLLPSQARHTAAPVELSVRVLNNPTQSYLYFFVLGLSLAAMQQGVFLAVGAGIQEERAAKVDRLYLRSPATMFAKLFPYWLSGLAAFALTIFVAVEIFSLPAKGALMSLLLLAGSFLLAAVAFSALLAALCPDELTFVRLSIAYTVPAFVLSGYTWPQASMGDGNQLLSALLPLSYLSDDVRQLLIGGYAPALYHDSLILVVIALFCCFGLCAVEKRRAAGEEKKQVLV